MLRMYAAGCFARRLQMFAPLVAPFVGAALGPVLGWRSTMWLLVIMGGLVEVAALVVYR